MIRPTAVADSIMAKLGINAAQLNSMFTSYPVDGWLGTDIAKMVEPKMHLLSEEERDWLDA